MQNWKDILENKAAYPDDYQISMPDKSSVSLGDLRSLNEETKGSVAKQLEKEREELGLRERNISDAEIAIGNRYTQLEQKQAELVERFNALKSTSTGEDIDPNDPLLGPVLKQLEETNKKLNWLAADYAKLKGAYSAVTNAYMDDYYESAWKDVKVPDGVKDLNLQKALQYASEHRLADRYGRPDVRKAVQEMTRDIEIENRIKKEREDAVKQSEKERLMGNIPRPGGQGVVPRPASKSNGKIPSIADAVDQAFQDSEILSGLGVQ